MLETTPFFTALAGAFVAADAAFPAGLAAAVALAASLAPGVPRAEAPLAAAALIEEDARDDAAGAMRAAVLPGTFAAGVFSLVLATFLTGAFALVVFAAVLADFAAVFLAALVALLAALVAVLAAALVALLAAALVALLAADLPRVAEALAGVFAAVLALDALTREAAVAAFERAALAVFAAEPREREFADLPAPLFFSFFVADGIRGLLLLRPAVETGRNCRPPTACGNKPPGRQGLSI